MLISNSPMFITWLINSSPNFSLHFLHHSYNGQFAFSGYADEKKELLTSVADRDKRPGFHLVAAHLNRELSGPSEQPDWFQFSLKCLNISLNIYTVCVFQQDKYRGHWMCYGNFDLACYSLYVFYGVAVIYCLNYGPLLTCQQKLLNSVPVYMYLYIFQVIYNTFSLFARTFACDLISYMKLVCLYLRMWCPQWTDEKLTQVLNITTEKFLPIMILCTNTSFPTMYR